VPELFSRKSILKLANPNPLVVDAEVRLADLGATLLVENPDALIECFVVTRRGRYLGVGTGEALLQGKVKLLQAREAGIVTRAAGRNPRQRRQERFPGADEP
jgi:hypothetical protein